MPSRRLPRARVLVALVAAVGLAACSGSAAAPSVLPAGPLGTAARYALDTGSDVVLVQRGGRTLVEVGTAGWNADRPHRLASGTKSFAGALGVALAGAGVLSLDARAATLLPEWRADPQKSRITVRDLLDQSSGLKPTGGLPAADVYRAALEAPMVHEPGTTFDYGPNHFNAFGLVVQRALRRHGIAGDPLDYLEAHVFRPIGLTVAGWDHDAMGQPLFATGADLSATEWAKFGRLIAQHGRWDGKVVLRPALVDQMLAPSPANPRYGLGWWRNPGPEGEDLAPIAGIPPDLVMAAGAGDQRLIVVPSRRLVMVRFGEDDRFEDRAFFACVFSDRCPKAPPAS
jgi:CubicO group peptidase (beta-lactamase class C family)